MKKPSGIYNFFFNDKNRFWTTRDNTIWTTRDKKTEYSVFLKKYFHLSLNT